MEQIRNKLRSQSGASILLALLFFLLCAMVGASVLMAAVSNAGKARSNREEQQKYFTLSSALQLVCDELTQAEYTAKYTLRVEEYTKEESGTDADGNSITVEVHDYWEHRYEQKQGDYTGKLSEETENVLPLLEELDWLSSELFNVPNETSGDPKCYYQPLLLPDIKEPGKHTLMLNVEAADGTGLLEEVVVTVQLGKTNIDKYRLYLKAELASDSNYTMYAELINTGTPVLTTSGTVAEGTYSKTCTPAIQWTVGQITKKPSINSPL